MRFDSYHPMINFIYFAAAITCTILFQHPIFLGISFACAFLYSVKLNGIRSFLLNLVLVVFAGIYTAWYSFYNHFGVTVLMVNFIDNEITLEAVVYGFVRGMTAATVIIWFTCIFTLITSDKVIYLFGRISPKMSLFLSVILRAVPRIKIRTKRIYLSRKGIGKGVKVGNPMQRLMHVLDIISILISWTMEDFVESATSMKCRGYSLKGRTSFSIYRFDNRDRALVIGFFWLLTGVFMASLFNQTRIYYDPVIIMNRITVLSYVFYFIYALFLLLPMILQILGEYRFKKLVEEKVKE